MATHKIFNLFTRVGGLSEIVIKASEYHESLLIVSDDEIRLDVKFLDIDKISHRMRTWNNEINFDTWGKLIVCENNKAYKNGSNESVSIDFSESKLLTYKSSTDSPYISFYIDRIKYIYDYPTNKNEAIFWINDAGYRFIQDYYNTSWGIKLPERMKIEAHDILGARCYPYFNFYRANESNSKEIIIKKTPKIKWYDFSDVESVIKYNDWICQLVSLFYGNDINYTGGQIDFEGRRTVIFQILSISTLKSREILLYFNGLHDIYQFINAVSFDNYMKHSKKINRIIERFIQSLYLDGSTRYLALYNILELCKSTYNKDNPQKDSNENPTINAILQKISNCLKKGYDDAIKGIEDKSIQQKITIQYNAANSALNKEPTGQGMESFIKQFFYLDKIRHYAKKDIFKLRNAIIHGDSRNISNEINDIVEHIGVILILKLLGCPIQINDSLGYSDIYKEEQKS